jgi:xylulokinase
VTERDALGIDLGTGSVKVALVGPDDSVQQSTSRAYPIHSPHSGWAETHPQDWLSALTEAVGKLDISQVESVSFSGQMHGVVAVDEHLDPVRPAILWADTRSADQSERMATEFGAKDWQRWGSRPVAGFAASTITWLVENEPAVLERTRYLMQPKDWLRARLGGDIATDPSDASGTLLFDVAAGTWDAISCEWVGIDPVVLPPVRASQAAAGVVRIAGRDIPSTVGGADTACAIAGIGLSSGQGFIAVGSGSQSVAVTDHVPDHLSQGTHVFAGVGEPGSTWYRIGAVQNAGVALERVLSWLDASIEDAIDALRIGVQPADPIFIPYVAGERTPFMSARLRGSWIGLDLATERSALLRSALEGISHAVALGFGAVRDADTQTPVPLIGGGAKDPIFQQLLSNSCGVPLAPMDTPDSAVIGAAALSRGRTSTISPAQWSHVVEPQPHIVDLLADRRRRLVEHVERELS